MKNTWKWFIIGGLAGGLIGILGSFGIDMVKYLNAYYPLQLRLVVSSILLLLLVISLITAFSYYKETKKLLSKEQSDEENIRLIDIYNKSSLYASLGLPLTLLWLTSSLMFFESFLLLITIVGLFFIFFTTYLCRALIKLLPQIYNGDYEYDAERKDMNRIWINSMDEGERLITLQSLFNCYASLIFIAVFSMLILCGYSVVSNNSQLPGIFLIGIMIAASSFVYYRTAAKYNR
ncbi:DUF3169 family protein [Macrococcus brunensis]|uniref:DUF3169 family protein n=1 Tax=Macrococcus brunensis TaxID=198483 RepID=A0A4R6BEV7_9STAP|nr:DUF3169 family protein [Macrococcus brunensis]TDL98263.1 DUF3169 family protein [Macrococcus brunensis]